MGHRQADKNKVSTHSKISFIYWIRSDGLLTSTDLILISLTMAYGIGRNIALERNKADFL